MTFFNIFSNKSEDDKKKIKVIVDNREKNSLVPSELVKIGFDIQFAQLPVGDYIINDIAIERKTFSDLKNSIVNKRIFSQLKEIKQYPFHLLIIEGKDSLNYNVLHDNALRGFIISVQLDYKVPIIISENELDTAKYISILSRRSKKEISIRAKKISLNAVEQAKYILEGFPNIGPVKADKLIKKFGSLKNVINSDINDIYPILGEKSQDFLQLVSHLE